MFLKISSELRTELLNAAREADPQECCGLLMGHNDSVTDKVTDTVTHTVTGILPAANVSDTPHTHFEIDPAVLIAAEKAVRVRSGAGQGDAILGYYHSHPSGKAVPSATDAQMAAMDGRYWVVIASEELGVFRAVQDGEVWGRFDRVEVLDYPAVTRRKAPKITLRSHQNALGAKSFLCCNKNCAYCNTGSV